MKYLKLLIGSIKRCAHEEVALASSNDFWITPVAQELRNSQFIATS